MARIVANQLADAKDKEIDPSRLITDMGMDEVSLKKRHKLYEPESFSPKLQFLGAIRVAPEPGATLSICISLSHR